VGTNAVTNRAETTAFFLFFLFLFDFFVLCSYFRSSFISVCLCSCLSFSHFFSLFFFLSELFRCLYFFVIFLFTLFFLFILYLTLCHSFILCFFYILPNFATFQKSEFRFSKICGCVFKILLPDVSNEDTFFIFKSKGTAFLQKTSGTINTDSSPTRTES
jgi:hypothetical protein